MSVRIKVNPVLQRFTEDKRVVEVSGDTIATCLDNLITKHPDVKSKIYDNHGNLLALVLIGAQVLGRKDLERSIEDGAELSLITALGGG